MRYFTPNCMKLREAGGSSLYCLIALFCLFMLGLI